MGQGHRHGIAAAFFSGAGAGVMYIAVVVSRLIALATLRVSGKP
jgi:hypothetical protein